MMGSRLTGEPCWFDTECRGGECFTETDDSVTWPEGYCTSYCDPATTKLDTGLNLQCPGKATCDDDHCYDFCGFVARTRPCQRDGYSCFYLTYASGCLPTAESECNPTRCSADCPKPNQTCMRAGFDDVGRCADRCDPVAQDCTAANAGCFPSSDCAEAGCLPAAAGLTDGFYCNFPSQCAPGFACYNEGLRQRCRPYCGGPNKIPCPDNRLCVPFTAAASIDTIGVCAP